MLITFPEPTLPPRVDPCADCMGLGVTGHTYTLPCPTVGPDIAVAEICPACHGCGAATHDACIVGVHALDPFPDDGDIPRLPHYTGQPGCFECSGRGWTAAQGTQAGDPDETLVLLRVPCSCVARAEVAAPG